MAGREHQPYRRSSLSLASDRSHLRALVSAIAHCIASHRGEPLKQVAQGRLGRVKRGYRQLPAAAGDRNEGAAGTVSVQHNAIKGERSATGVCEVGIDGQIAIDGGGMGSQRRILKAETAVVVVGVS